MSGELGADYKSGSQRARVVTESWGEHNLYCPNCSSPKLGRLSHNTQASDFACPKCHFFFQLKGQQSRIGNSITDGAYASMMRAIQRDEAPSYYFMHYEIGAFAPSGEKDRMRGQGEWVVRNLLLVPHFAFPPSAIIKRNPTTPKGRSKPWIGCNFALNRIPADARIPIVTTRSSGREPAHSKFNQGLLTSAATIITPPEEVRERFRRVKPLKDLSVAQRGWTLDVLNIVRRITARNSPALRDEPAHSKLNQSRLTSAATNEFTNADVYAYERELAALHPDNRHIRDKIRQQLQVLRDTGFLSQPERGVWHTRVVGEIIGALRR
jgi:type II restriction enzyme